MFKIEVTKADTSVVGYYWMNKHEDDFVQFLPSQFTRALGETITKDDIAVYKIAESSKDLLEGKISVHEKNCIDCSTETGKIKVCRKDSAKYSLDEYIRLAEFTDAKAAREAMFADSATPQTVTVPATEQYDFGDGLEDAVKLVVGNELISDYTTTELSLTGTALSPAYPYDVNGVFLGNL